MRGAALLPRDNILEDCAQQATVTLKKLNAHKTKRSPQICGDLLAYQ